MLKRDKLIENLENIVTVLNAQLATEGEFFSEFRFEVKSCMLRVEMFLTSPTGHGTEYGRLLTNWATFDMNTDGEYVGGYITELNVGMTKLNSNGIENTIFGDIREEMVFRCRKIIKNINSISYGEEILYDMLQELRKDMKERIENESKPLPTRNDAKQRVVKPKWTDEIHWP